MNKYRRTCLQEIQMTDNKILKEVPIPDDWDRSKLAKSGNSFKAILDYAKSKAKKIGTGSSRVAFIIPYQGRETVLKIAKNQKGIVQNEQEIDLFFKDSYFEKYNIVIPGIDYDENDPPIWIHVEKAEKMTESAFKRIIGIGLFEAVQCAKYIAGEESRVYNISESNFRRLMGEVKDENFINELADFISSYHNIVTIGDLVTPNNWGVYKGKPVIIDIGFGPRAYRLYGFW
jgi:hypothetical protein